MHFGRPVTQTIATPQGTSEKHKLDTGASNTNPVAATCLNTVSANYGLPFASTRGGYVSCKPQKSHMWLFGVPLSHVYVVCHDLVPIQLLLGNMHLCFGFVGHDLPQKMRSHPTIDGSENAEGVGQ